MKHTFLSMLVIYLTLFSCNRNQDVQNISEFEAYIGNIKVSKVDSSVFFHIHVSAMMINNTNNNFTLKLQKQQFGISKQSNFMGVIGDDTISFKTYNLPRQFEAHDSIYCILKHLWYDPKMSDSLFFEKLSCMELFYSLPKDSIEKFELYKREKLNFLEYLHFTRQDSSKFIILGNNKIEGGFAFGLYEFKSIFPYAKFDDYEMFDEDFMSILKGKYLKDLCPK